MRAITRRFGPHIGLILARTAAVVLFTLAGVTLAGVYFHLVVALLVGVTVGVLLGLAADRAAVLYGRRLGWVAFQEHSDRQAAARREAREAAEMRSDADSRRELASRRNAARADAWPAVVGPFGIESYVLGEQVLRGGNGGPVFVDQRMFAPGADGGPWHPGPCDNMTALADALRPSEAREGGSRLVDGPRPAGELAGGEAATLPDVVMSVLESGPDSGMSALLICVELERRRGTPVPRVEVYATLSRLEAANRVVRPAARGPYMTAERGLLAALSDRIVAVVTAADDDGGLDIEAITAAVTAGAEPLDVTPLQVLASVRALVERQELWQAGNANYQLPPF